MIDASPSRLRSHHIRRARPAEPLVHARLVVVEAAGGYGKSVLAAELVDRWGALPIWVALESDGVSARLLAARLRAAAPREAAQRTMLELLDLCAETAARDGDLDESRRMVERTIELAP